MPLKQINRTKPWLKQDLYYIIIIIIIVIIIITEQVVMSVLTLGFSKGVWLTASLFSCPGLS